MLVKQIIEKQDAQKIKDTIDNEYFNWYFQNNIISKELTEQISGFTHFFCKEGNIVSEQANILEPLFKALQRKLDVKIIRVERVQANLLINQIVNEEIIKNCIHTDLTYDADRKFISFVYYVLDSDGDTIVYNSDMSEKERSSPIMGDLIWFNSNELHTMGLPKKHKKRVVINSIIEVENI